MYITSNRIVWQLMVEQRCSVFMYITSNRIVWLLMVEQRCSVFMYITSNRIVWQLMVEQRCSQTFQKAAEEADSASHCWSRILRIYENTCWLTLCGSWSIIPTDAETAQLISLESLHVSPVSDKAKLVNRALCVCNLISLVLNMIYFVFFKWLVLLTNKMSWDLKDISQTQQQRPESTGNSHLEYKSVFMCKYM